MQINKIKCLKGGDIEIKTTEFIGKEGKDKKVSSVRYPESPSESFEKSLMALCVHACALCEFPTGDVKKLKVFGMEIHRKGEHQVIGATLFVTRELQKSDTNLTFHSPLKFIDKPKEGPDKGDVFTKEAAVAVKNLIKEAERYVEGERLQTDAFDKKS